jgi:endogenous inhibitor of DNA gyrase (YacG/DUF329 family)
MTEIKISDEDVEIAAEAAFWAEDRRETEDWAALAGWEKDSYRHLVRQIMAKLVASGWRREAEVLREAAERMRSSCRHLDGRVFCMSRADDLDRWAAEAEQYVSAGTRETEDQKRDEEREHG